MSSLQTGQNYKSTTFQNRGHAAIKWDGITYYCFESVKISKAKSVAHHKILYAKADMQEITGFDSALIQAQLFFYNNVEYDSWDKATEFIRDYQSNIDKVAVLELPDGFRYNCRLTNVSETITPKHQDGYVIDVSFIEELIKRDIDSLDLLNTSFTSTGLSDAIPVPKFIPNTPAKVIKALSLFDKFNNATKQLASNLGKANLFVQQQSGKINQVVGNANTILDNLNILESTVFDSAKYIVQDSFNTVNYSICLKREQIIKLIQALNKQKTIETKTPLKTYITIENTTISQVARLLNVSVEYLNSNNQLEMFIKPNTVIRY